MLRYLALIAILPLAACSSSGSQRCKDVCEREAECAAATINEGKEGIKFDKDECVAACVSLERDNEGHTAVETHASCVYKASDCNDVLECGKRE